MSDRTIDFRGDEVPLRVNVPLFALAEQAGVEVDVEDRTEPMDVVVGLLRMMIATHTEHDPETAAVRTWLNEHPEGGMILRDVLRQWIETEKAMHETLITS